MACTIDPTPSGLTANSYATIAEGDAYHDTHPYPTVWEDAGEDEKCRALVTATRMLDSWFDWYGIVTVLGQALLWPRSGVLRPGVAENVSGGIENPWHEPFAVQLDPYTIPKLIREATAELARALLAGDRTADSDTETQGIRSLRAGPVSIDFSASVMAKPIPDAVMTMVSGLGQPRMRTGSGAITLRRA